MVRRKTSKRSRKGDVTSGPAVPRRDYILHSISTTPQHTRRTLVWAYNFGATISTGYSEPAVTILNSPYDPDAALGGVSAVGFAKLMAFYSKCFAIGARARVKYCLTGAAAGVDINITACAVGYTITTNSTSLGGIVAAVQTGLTDYQMRLSSPDHGEVGNSVDVAKFVDKPRILDDPQFFCTNAANPTQLIVGHFWVQNFSVSNTYMSAIIEVEMDCIFTDPIPFT
jgi:hypothetical protein